MKIFHILSNRTWGGGEVYVLNLAKEQRDNGHSVEIICADRPVLVDIFRNEGFNVHVFRLHGHLNFFSPRKFARILSDCGSQTVVHVHRIPDIVFASKAIGLLPETKRPAFVITHHLIDIPFADKKFDKPYAMIDQVICVSHKSKNTLLSVPSGIDPAKVSVILNSTKVISRQSDRTDNPDNSPVNITYLGRLVPEKGVDTLIEALPMIHCATLTICGGGSDNYVASLRALAERLGVNDRIRWIGFTDRIAEYISHADIGVIPSRWQEPCALVNFEFMAAGVPLVTSDTGGQPEIITDGVDGFLVPSDDPDALANAINRLAGDPDLRFKMGKAARETFLNRFTYDNFYRQVMDVYDKALKSKEAKVAKKAKN